MMASDELDRFTVLYITHVLYALICLQLRSTLSLLVLVLSAGRRHRLMVQQCANSAFSALLQLGPSLLPRVSRKCWMRVRSKDWWDRVVLKEFSDAEWREHFRMTRGSFDKLCALMEEVLRPQDVTVRAPIPLQMRVAIVLYKLASCAEYKVIANKFGVHKTTVKKFVYSFCKGMVSSVINRLIRAPTAEEARAITRRFEEKFCIPQVVGCIHRTHIPVLPPSDGFKHFVNRKGWPSYILQAVTDDTCRFWNINCQMPGSTADADVLRQAALYSQAHLLPQEPKEISGSSVNLFLLGDPAYPLLDWLITEYAPSPHLTAEQESFNAYVRSARTTVDTAFGKLKSRWRVLLRKCDFHYTFIPHVIATCCALHNFCEVEEEGFSPAWTEEAAVMERRMLQPDVFPCGESECSDGQRVRLTLTEYLRINFPLHKSEF
ncbi:hypothetical protein OJAV_G00132490 [Oryzias javanicus]|uniref:DDE Tnp4 domain-containing protein n=1 Tax=Oryzias javanicus TaxID=123683 RepID=A0A437CRB0_ORYJA|nr:hypothetical protein OJAV_G00132490 [Oryzias javanicus]